MMIQLRNHSAKEIKRNLSDGWYTFREREPADLPMNTWARTARSDRKSGKGNSNIKLRHQRREQVLVREDTQIGG